MKLPATSLVSRLSIQRGCIRSSSVSGRNSAVAITSCSRFNCERDPTLDSCALERVDKLVRFECFMVNFVKSRNAIVPFQKCGGVADQLQSVSVQFPNRVEHRVIVRVENVFFELRMPRNMDLADPMMRHVIRYS